MQTSFKCLLWEDAKVNVGDRHAAVLLRRARVCVCVCVRAQGEAEVAAGERAACLQQI